MVTMLENYTFNQSIASNTVPWGQDTIIFLLMIIAICQVFGVLRYFFWRYKI